MEIQTINKNIVQNGKIPIIHDALTRRDCASIYIMAKVSIRQVKVNTYFNFHPICLRCMFGANTDVQEI